METGKTFDRGMELIQSQQGGTMSQLSAEQVEAQLAVGASEIDTSQSVGVAKKYTVMTHTRPWKFKYL